MSTLAGYRKAKASSRAMATVRPARRRGGASTSTGAMKRTGAGSGGAARATTSAAASSRRSRSGSSAACTRPRWREGHSSASQRGSAPNAAMPGGRLSMTMRAWPSLPTRLAITPAKSSPGRYSFSPSAIAPKVCAIALASITASTGSPSRSASAALEALPSCRPITPSTRIRSASPAACQSSSRQ